MATKVSFSGKITNQLLINAVATNEDSKRFIKKLIPTALGYILYKRTDLHPTNFQTFKWNGIIYKTFKTPVKNPTLKLIWNWIIGVLDAFEKNYLRELFFIFRRSENDNSVLELYKFHFQYSDNMDSIQGAGKVPLDLMAAVEDLFESIECLEGEKLTDFVPYICTTHYTDVTPPEYEPPFFDQLSDEEILTNLSSLSKNITTLSNINTGFHTLQCFKIVMLNMDQTSNECESHSPSIDNSIEDEDQLGIRCICQLQEYYENVDMIKCKICKFTMHAPCVGYIYVQDVGGPYTCQQCQNTQSSKSLLPTKEQLISTYRLVFVYMYFNSDIPYGMLCTTNSKIRDFIWTKLLDIGVIEPHGFEERINTERLQTGITTLFSYAFS